MDPSLVDWQARLHVEAAALLVAGLGLGSWFSMQWAASPGMVLVQGLLSNCLIGKLPALISKREDSKMALARTSVLMIE